MAQIALSYSYNFDDRKYVDYVCILSVVAQVAIDNAKRNFDINVTEEIKRIKKDMDISKYKYPKFWSLIRRDTKREKINHSLICPMNYLCDVKFEQHKPNTSTLPMSYFFQKCEINKNEIKRRSKKVEELIEKYSLELYNYNTSENRDVDDYLLLREDFDELIDDISRIYISTNYEALMCWLIDRAFMITNKVKANKDTINTNLNKNKAILLKVLYKVNPKMLLKIFSKNC